MSDKPTSLIMVIDALRSASRLDRATVEHATGAKLTSASENGSFSFFESHDVKLHDVTLGKIDYREPRTGDNATAGPLLNLKVIGCPKRADIEARYGPFQVVGVPRGRSLDEETQLARTEPWGKLSFGFSERTPACLTTITFDHTPTIEK